MVKPEQQEIERLRRNPTKMKAERDMQKSGRLLRQGLDMRFEVVAKDRGSRQPQAMLTRSSQPRHGQSKYDPRRGWILIQELKAARLSAGWSRRTLSERIGVDAQTIKRLENGVASMPTMIAVMTVLDFSLTGLGPGKTLVEQLRGRRQRRSMLLNDAALQAGLSRVTVANLKRGGGTVTSFLRLRAFIAPNARRRAVKRVYWGRDDKDDRDSRFTRPNFIANIYRAFGDIDLGTLRSPPQSFRREPSHPPGRRWRWSCR